MPADPQPSQQQPKSYLRDVSIGNLEAAELYLKHYIKGGYWDRFPPVWPVSIGHVHGKKGPIAVILRCTEHLGTSVNVYAFFKREWFYNFSKIYENQPNGVGQSINIEALRKAVNDDAVIAIVMPDKVIYHTTAKEWHDYISLHKTIRRPSTEGSYEGSIPGRMLKVLGAR